MKKWHIWKHNCSICTNKIKKTSLAWQKRKTMIDNKRTKYLLCKTVFTWHKFLLQTKHFVAVGLPFTWPWHVGAAETANIWNLVPEWDLLKSRPSFCLCKLTGGVPVNVVTMLMLMLVQVNVFPSSHYQTNKPICWFEFVA